MAFNLIERLLQGARALIGGPLTPPQAIPPQEAFIGYRDTYEVLYEYYANVGLYQQVRRELLRRNVPHEAIRGIYNPAYRTVEFYVDHVWPGPLATAIPIEGASAGVKSAIEQVWEWSNWETKKQLAVRQPGIFGDQFLKVAQGSSANQRRVFIQLTDPRLVTELTADERDYLTMIRLDENTWVDPDNSGIGRPMVRTEIWDKARQDMRVWLHAGLQYNVEMLSPQETHPFAEYGIDFIPFVHTKFKDTGENRGMGAYTMAVDKIDEVNRSATRLHQILYRYNRATLALTAGGMGPDQRPLPQPRIANAALDPDGDGPPFGDDEMISLPGTNDVKFLVPNLDYNASLAVVNGQMSEIEKDLPEILWYRLTDMNDPTGRSIRYYLGPGIQRVIAVRAALEAGLIRANQMALTIGANMGLEAFTGLGKYENGDFDHRFTTREVIPVDDLEEGQSWQAKGQAATYWHQIGIKPEVIATKLGFKTGDVGEPPAAPPFGGRGTPQNAPLAPSVQPKPNEPPTKEPTNGS